MAELGTAVVRVIPDTTGLNARLAGYFSSSQWSKLGKTAGAALGAGIAAGGAVKALYEVGQAFDDASDKIRVGTGKTGKALRGLEKDFKRVIKTTPTEFGAAADAITDLNRRLGLTGKPLRQMSRQMLELSRITETDLGGNIETVSKAFKDWEVKTKKQSKTLDGFFRLSQKTGIAVDDIASSVQRFGSPLRQLGLDLDESAALFANFERAGVNTQTMVPGLKLAISALSEPSADLADKMDKLGIAAGKPAKGLGQVMEILGDTSRSKVERIGLAMDVFGKRAGPDMKEAIEQGRFAVDDLLKVFKNDNGDSIGKASKATQDFTEHWLKFRNKVMVWLEPLSKKVFKAVGDEAKKLFKIISDPKLSFNEKLEAVFGRAMELIGKLAPKLARAFFQAWWDAGVWAKLATLGFIAWKMGAIQKLGTKVAGWFAAKFMEIVGTRVAAALAANGALYNKVAHGKSWNKIGSVAGRVFGIALIAAAIAYIALHREDIQRTLKEQFNIGEGSRAPWEPPGSSPDTAGKPWYEPFVGGIPGLRKGGLARFASGGVLSAVSSGEMLAFPDGSSVKVPGQRTRADNVLTRLPVGTAVFTDHGQRLLASGASPGEALTRQMPHFASGGLVARAAHSAGFRGPGLVRMVAEAKGESGWNERAVGDGGNSRGLWQIHLPSHPWARAMNLFNPFTNAKAARRVFVSSGNSFGPWHANHVPHIAAARQAVAQMGGASRGSVRDAASGGDPGDFRSALSGAFTAGREGRSLRGVRSRILRAVSSGSKRPKRASTSSASVSGSAPGRVAAMVNWAASASARHPNYVYGGGHGTLGAGPFDCSGFVSGILGKGGFLSSPVTTDGLKTFGVPGDGKFISIGVRGSTGRNAHTMIRLGHGKNRSWWEAGSSGVGRRSGWSGAFPIRRHPKGFRRGGIAADLPRRVKEMLWADPALLDPNSRQFVGFGLRRGGIAGFQDGGITAEAAAGPFAGAYQTIRRLWEQVKRVTGTSMRRPRIRVRETAGSYATYRWPYITIDDEFARRMTGGRMPNRAKGVLLHELAHAAQKTKVLKRNSRSEGGATAFVRRHGRGIWKRLGYGFNAGAYGSWSYPGATAKVLRNRSNKWIKRGQFYHGPSFRDGGKVGGAFGHRAVSRSYVPSVLGAAGAGESVLREYARFLNEMTFGQIRKQLKRWSDELGKADGAQAARIRGAAALAKAEILHRAGQFARKSDALGREIEARNLTNRVTRTAFGINMDTAFGMDLQAEDAARDVQYMERRRKKLRRALELARAAKDAETVKALRQELGELHVTIQEGIIARIETARAAIQAALQEKFDVAGGFRSIAETRLQGFELDQQLAGTFDTQAGREARAAFIQSSIIPAIRAQQEALKPMFEAALKTQDPLDELDIWNQYFGLENEIKGLQVESKDLLAQIEENTSEVTEAMNELLKQQLLVWKQRFRVSQAQYGVFAGMPAFDQGGVVPGPVGAPRMVMAHGGETVLPTHKGGALVQVIVEDGAVDPDKIRVIASSAAQGELRRSARAAGRGLPGRGGGVLAHG